MSYNVSFNGVSIPSFVKVQAVDYPALGTVTTNIVQKTGGNGGIFSSLAVGSKKIKLKVKIVPQTTGDTIPSMLRTLAEWLRGNNWQPSVLYFSDDPSIFYDAVIDDGVDITDLLFAGEGDISFIVPSGVGRGAIHSNHATVDLANKTATLIYNGTAPSSAFIYYKPSYSLGVGGWQMVVTETGDRLSIDFFESGTETNIDCEARRIISTGQTSIKYVNLVTTEWIKFPKRGTYHLTWNFDPDCELTIAATEYYY